MVDVLTGVIIAAELAIFFVILIYVILIDAISGSRIPASINMFAGALTLVSGIKFFTSILEIRSAFLTEFLSGALSLIAGFGLIFFLNHINKNIEEYR